MTDERDELDQWLESFNDEPAPAPDARFVRELRAGLMAQAERTNPMMPTNLHSLPAPPGRWLDRRALLQIAAVMALVFAWVGTLAGGGPRAITDYAGSWLQQDAAATAPSMFRGNNARTGVVDEAGPAENPVLGWEVTPTEPGFNIVNATETTILLAYEQAGRLVALDRADGAERWRFDTGCAFVGTTPMILDGTVYVSATCSSAGALFALSETDGRLVWRTDLAENVQSSPIVVDNSIYVMLYGVPATIAAFDAGTGVQEWRTAIERNDKPITPVEPDKYIGNVAFFSPAYGERHLYVTAFDGVVHSIDAESGVVAWSYDTGGNAISTPSFVDDRLYLSYAGITMADVEGGFLALDAATGELIWEVALPDHSPYTSPVITDGLALLSLYYLPAERRTIAWNLETGEEIWQLPFAGTMMLADGTLYLLELGTGEALAIDPTTGSILWKAFIANYEWPPSEATQIRDEPILQNGALITGSQAERVLVIESQPVPDNSVASPSPDVALDFTDLPACVPPAPIAFASIQGAPALNLIPVNQNQREGLPAAIHPNVVPGGEPVDSETAAELSNVMDSIRACTERQGEADVSGFFSEDYFRRVWVAEQIRFNGPAVITRHLVNAASGMEVASPWTLPDGRIALELPVSDRSSYLLIFVPDGEKWVIDELIEVTPHPEGKG